MKMRYFFVRLSDFPAFLIASVVLVLLTGPLALTAQNPEPGIAKPAGVPSYRAGGESIAIPQPTNDLVEVGSDNRVIMEMFVPDQNRLLAAFTLSDDLPKLRSGGKNALSKYSLVEVPRRAEFADFSAKDFNGLVEGASKEFGAVLNSSVKESEDGLNRRMKALNLDDSKIILDKPAQLGSFFSKQDAYGVGMIMPISKDGNTTKMVVGIIFLRARNRMLFAYVYATYRDQETVRWMRKTTEEWADAILKSNGQ